MGVPQSWPLVASLALHGLVVGGLTLATHQSGQPQPHAEPRVAVEVVILDVGAPSVQGVSARAPDAQPGVPKRRRPRRSVEDTAKPPEPELVGVDEAEQKAEAPTGSGTGALGLPRLGRGDLSALVRARVQHVADLLSGSRTKREVLLSFDVDARGYVVGYRHGAELDPVLHLAEPFAPSACHYEFIISF